MKTSFGFRPTEIKRPLLAIMGFVLVRFVFSLLGIDPDFWEATAVVTAVAVAEAIRTAGR